MPHPTSLQSARLTTRIGRLSRGLLYCICYCLCGLAGLTVAGCADTVPTPPRFPRLDGVSLTNFDRVSPGVYRGAQPSNTQLAELVSRYGVKSVVQLNHGSDASVPGLKLVVEPLWAFITPDHDTVARILDAIDAAPKPVFIHCTHGEDRTGLIVALYKMRHGASTEEAFADMIRHGFHPYTGVWAAWLRESGWDHPERRAPVAER